MNAIVVGVDGSKGAVAAVRWAARYAEEAGAPLRLVHAPASADTVSVILPVPMGVSSAGLRPPAPSRARVLEDAALEAGRYGPEPSTRTVTEGIVPALLEASAEAKLIVLGAAERRRLASTLFGSVAGRVAAAASCPVVVVRGESEPAGPIVVAVDDGDDAALRFAFTEAARRDCALFAVRAWQPPLMPTATATAEAAPPVEYEIPLGDVLEPWRTAFPDVAVHERRIAGRPENVITEETYGAALVVVGSRGRSPLTGLLFGSTSQALLHRSNCPVAVVRDPVR